MAMEKQAGTHVVDEPKGKKRAGDTLPSIAKRPKMGVHTLPSIAKRPKMGVHASEALIADCAAQQQPWKPSPALLKQMRSLKWGSFRVGTSGYVYNHWKNIVYPGDSNPKDWFQLYTKLFDTVEINNSFYRLPSPQAVDSWRSQAPPGFCYALKFSRYGTHMKRLKDPEGPISLFLGRATRLGDDFLGPILVQLPPNFELNIERLSSFLEKVPKQHRWAMEFRDPSWLCDEVYSSLRAHGVSLCIHDHEDITISHPKVLTTNWTYLRFHGCNYRNRYKLHELQASASWIKDMLRKGLDVYAYFNNDFNGYAPINALELRDLVYQTGGE